MDKPRISEKTFKLKEQTAIDVINSMYSYGHVKFFLDLVPALLLKNDLHQLNQIELKNISLLIKIISKLIDSSSLLTLTGKFDKYQAVKSKSKCFKKRKVDVIERSESLSNDMLIWVNSLPIERRRKMSTVVEMEEFFTSDFFFKEFVKWSQKFIYKQSMTLVELLDVYYDWFPIKPQSIK